MLRVEDVHFLFSEGDEVRVLFDSSWRGGFGDDGGSSLGSIRNARRRDEGEKVGERKEGERVDGD